MPNIFICLFIYLFIYLLTHSHRERMCACLCHTYAEFCFLSILFTERREVSENVYSMQTCQHMIGGCIRNWHGRISNFILSFNFHCSCSEPVISLAGEFAISARRQSLIHGRFLYSVRSRVLYSLLSLFAACSLRVFERKVMRKIYGLIENQDEGWIIRTNEEKIC